MAIINTDYPGNLGELARGLILIVGAVQVHKRDHVREVRLYAHGLLDISVYSPLSYPLAPCKGNPHSEIRKILAAC